jgi:hypothetical protein
MEYRKLNLIDGSDQDLKDFMSLLKEALEYRTKGASELVDAQAMSHMIAAGYISANVAFDESGIAGIQVWEKINFWFDFSKSYNGLRIQYLTKNNPVEHIKFMQFGASLIKELKRIPIVIAASMDQLSEVMPVAGLTKSAEVLYL